MSLRLLEQISTIPIKNAGHTKSVMLNEKPADIIHAVSVVPMFAPMITEMACTNVSNPAFTKLTVITVVAVDDCTAAVMNVQFLSEVRSQRSKLADLPDDAPVLRGETFYTPQGMELGLTDSCKTMVEAIVETATMGREYTEAKKLKTAVYNI